jgi:hypothetical protein
MLSKRRGGVTHWEGEGVTLWGRGGGVTLWMGVVVTLSALGGLTLH